MSTEQNKATARRWFTDVLAQQKLAVADEIFAANHVIHDPHGPPAGWPTGPQGPKTVATGPIASGCPDLKVTIEDQIAEGDRVATRWSAIGTHKGPMAGVPATGKTVKVTGVNVTRFAGGQIVESWFNFDLLTLLQQIGAIPTPEPRNG